MALCIRLEPIYAQPTADSIAEAFAKNDLILKHMAVLAHEPEDGETVSAIDPGDDYYTAPYGLVKMKMRKRKGEAEPPTAYWVVFTAYKCRSAHDKCIAKIRVSGVTCAAIALGSIQDIEDGGLGVRVAKKNIMSFRRYENAGGDDVCLKLEEHTFKSICEATSTAYPVSWRELRAAKLTEMGGDTAPGPLAVLTEWGEADFKPLTKEEEKAAAAERRERAVQEAEIARLAAIESKKAADECRMRRYASTMDEFKNVTDPASDGMCVYIFNTTPDEKEERFRCPYDRKEGSPFCSQCMIMIARV